MSFCTTALLHLICAKLSLVLTAADWSLIWAGRLLSLVRLMPAPPLAPICEVYRFTIASIVSLYHGFSSTDDTSPCSLYRRTISSPAISPSAKAPVTYF